MVDDAAHDIDMQKRYMMMTTYDDDDARRHTMMHVNARQRTWAYSDVTRWRMTMDDNDIDYKVQQEVTIVNPDLPTYLFCQLSTLTWMICKVQ